MNREIKFRAWDTENESMEWVAIFLIDEYKTYPHDRGYVHNCQDWEEHELICKPVIMQYTGLKDKNGKEIYEGDIVLFPDEEREFVDVGIGVPLQVAAQPVKEIAQVVFENGSFGFNCNRKSAYYEKGFTSFTLADFKSGLNELEDIEVIGNIYENPELLTNN